ncbi:hypothetical protein [Paractinoplanes abujensis]|uniref:Uncharacterized protein n=1 Tax=Paractinoplanes abujensis TaxID=882441 RepID=A0A7W7CPN5_9ACTN|nr:hypothetical protein [Actinoplanes abujensis]MBB4692427.1 hypothetical protein [Actinoplanes abujensis]
MRNGDDSRVPDGGLADDVPENVMFLSPEQYEALQKAREEQGSDLTREQWQAVLKAFEVESATEIQGPRNEEKSMEQ